MQYSPENLLEEKEDRDRSMLLSERITVERKAPEIILMAMLLLSLCSS